jgi:hypothetical protein
LSMSRRVSHSLLLAVVAPSALTLSLACATAWAQGNFPIEGTFTQNEACKDVAGKQKFLAVTITPKDVSYAGGVCTIDDKKLDGDTMAMRVTCKFKSGAVLSSAITFMRKDDNTFNMAQQDGTYRAVLYRCPG